MIAVVNFTNSLIALDKFEPFVDNLFLPVVLQVFDKTKVPAENFEKEELRTRCLEIIRLLRVEVRAGTSNSLSFMEVEGKSKIIHVNAVWKHAAEETYYSHSICPNPTNTFYSDQHVFLGVVKLLHELFHCLTPTILEMECEFQNKSIAPTSPPQKSLKVSPQSSQAHQPLQKYRGTPVLIGTNRPSRDSSPIGDMGYCMEEKLLGYRCYIRHTNFCNNVIYFERVDVEEIHGVSGPERGKRVLDESILREQTLVEYAARYHYFKPLGSDGFLTYLPALVEAFQAPSQQIYEQFKIQFKLENYSLQLSDHEDRIDPRKMTDRSGSAFDVFSLPSDTLGQSSLSIGMNPQPTRANIKA